MKNLLLALISGVLLAISWPTYGIPFFIFFAFVPLLMMEHNIAKFSNIKRKSLAIFGLSYLTFVIWNAVTTGWLYNSKLPDGSNSLLAVLFPVLTNAFFMSIIFHFYRLYKRSQGTYFGLVFFVVIWMAFEKLHLVWEFTWPWLNLGNVFADYHQFIQWYDTLGATGGSFWILICNVLAFYTFRIWEAGRKRKPLIKNVSMLAGFIILPMLISLVKYYNYAPKTVGTLNVTMLQPALDPYNEKYQKDSLTIESDLLKLGSENSIITLRGKETQNIDLYLSPETSLPGPGSISERGFNNSLLINNIKAFLTQHPKSVFAGGISSYYVYKEDEEKPVTASYLERQGIWVDEYNSAIQIIPNQQPEVYHKAMLVPGVEIFPYINFFKPILGDVMLDLGGTTRSLGVSKERKVFANPYNKSVIAPIICYESVYGEYVTDYVKKGANLLTIVTNDSWWGFSQGHKQLLAYAKLRAIETRREIARAANSGTSAHINSRGDIVDELPYGAKGALTAKINLIDKETFYTKSGDFLSRICLFVIGALLLFIPGRKYLTRKK
ncbi:apolipoprotein N-acyltransferase [Epilithonimonas ginsengisoli]|uniref:Apolipoprotein N-acyltransferase n=1 Tax=Epilithonimonas ginsengisoli TaxID=1245592 RepID=A0ABU4JI07_9FLAO|nr:MULTISPECIES: apolipoprotein N-acyltransferase [Chryseobacterium group]MBV6880761.1 apolipoprotein N-acyltransferase [Epilithonimonas sp. FP105]MDW8549308.1 apolipoprotein N-acyltransferase [Epilithonimonas ginsengisoli]OAH76277.1 acyltransferase [Chryseobacterium sp. FP211-J200]